MISAQVILDSVNPNTGDRITTIQTTYPRIIHAQVLRHGLIAHSVASSRAIPVATMVAEVMRRPYVPARFGANQRGMSPSEADVADEGKARVCWQASAAFALGGARELAELNVHKQWVNRLLEPYMYVSDVMTSTNWHPFLELREHHDAQEEIAQLASAIRTALIGSVPVYRDRHLPYDDGFDALVSAGILARASYGHVGAGAIAAAELEASRERGARLVAEGHLSPFEHICNATPKFGLHGKHAFRSWVPMAVGLSKWESEHRSPEPLKPYC